MSRRTLAALLAGIFLSVAAVPAVAPAMTHNTSVTTATSDMTHN